MRFPYTADLRIIRVSPISDDQPNNVAFDTTFKVPCFAAATSGTFDPDIQFSGDALVQGTFGQLVDIWISKQQHLSLTQRIKNADITFSASLQLRLTDLNRKLNNNQSESVLLFDNTAVVPPPPFSSINVPTEFLSSILLRPGFPLKATRIFPTLTALTFELKRLGV